MYLPKHFDRSAHTDEAQAFMRAHPFATLVSTDKEGFPFATHLPLHLDADNLRLWGHVAKPNPHWGYLRARPQALVLFNGPHAYMSPSVYPDVQRVPTWNYVVLQAKVSATLVESPEGKDALLKRLIGGLEPAYAQQWRGLDAEYQRKMLLGIVGFELRIESIQFKVKVNQHRADTGAHPKMLELYRAGNADANSLADWLEKVTASHKEPA